MRRLLLLTLSGVTLSGCGDGFQEQIGMRRTAPDEFAVVTRAPLSIPPDYALRPPRDGGAENYDAPVREVARQTVFGAGQATSTPKASDGFLAKIGTADPNIRSAVDGENAEGVEEGGKPVAEKLLFWKDAPENKGVKLDPVAEKKRLEETAATIKSTPEK